MDSNQKGFSLTFVKEVNARVQALHDYCDRHGTPLPPDLLEGVHQLNRHYRSQSDQLAFSANVSSVSEKSGVSKSPPVPFDLKELMEDGSVEAGFSPQEPDDAGLSLSFASSVYSTESKKSEARRIAAARKQELKEIRKSSRSVQQQVQTRVRDLRTETSQALEAECRVTSELTYYQVELERMKETVSKMLLGTSKTKTSIERVRDSALGSDLSAMTSSNRRQKPDSLLGSFVMGEQLKEMQRELSDLHFRLRNSEASMKAKEVDNRDLRQQVEKLEESLIALSGLNPSDKVQLEQETKAEACSDRCSVL